MPRSKVIMVFPMQGFSGSYVMHSPIGLLYASAQLVKHGWDVRILDTRLHLDDWRERLSEMIDDETAMVGISVMSGSPIHNAISIGRYVKSIDSDIKVVWGGPHATFYPDTILRDEWSADFVVSGYAMQSFYELCESFRAEKSPENIEGISWRDGAGIRTNKTGKTFEFIDYHDIPYDLIPDYSVYGQLGQQKRIFSMYSAVGCPYQCSFCSSPAQYRGIQGKKWLPLEAKQIADHVEHVVKKYGANYIYFIDDDSFPKLQHVANVIDAIKERDLGVGLGFRGARINEIKKMDDAFLEKLVDGGTDIMHIGAECGSNRMLNLIRKDCTVDDIIAANRKLARHPKITAAYNFIMGLPTETLEEIKQTRDLMMRLVDDNPNCIVFPPNKFRPLPGTELYEFAKKEWGYELPNTLEMWANIEVEADISNEWYTDSIRRFCNLMLISSYFIDNKIQRMSSGNSLFLRAARAVNKVYRPIARFRLKHGIDRGLIEYPLYRFATGRMLRTNVT